MKFTQFPLRTACFIGRRLCCLTYYFFLPYRYIECAGKLGVLCRCFMMTTKEAHAKHNERVRHLKAAFASMDKL